jgi:F-type H+-transporting ATPase subunit delta
MNNKLSRRIIAQVIATKLVEEPTRRSHWIKTLAAYMVEHNMINDLDLVVNDVVREVFEQSGELLVNVTTARPLTNELRKDIAKMLQGATKAKEITLQETVDPEIKGGFIARTSDAVIDDSIRSKLKQLASIK